MKLKLTRTQKTQGMVSKDVVFMLDARVELTDQEARDIKQYKLGNEVIYNSEKSKHHLDKAKDGLTKGGAGIAGAFASIAAARLSLNITVNNLVDGKHIECKSLEELLGAEDAVMEACRWLKTYLDTASAFDGREEVIDFDQEMAATA